MPGVLEGIKVVDFGRYIAGPFCGALLGDLGADVVRVEKLDGSEDRWVTPVGKNGEGTTFLQMNRNKRGMTLDPMTPKGREVAERLIKWADVVVANLPHVQLQQMGLDYDTISKINPRIILAMTSTFGSTGPYKDRVGFDTVGQAMSGSMYLTGDGSVPMRVAVPVVDYGTAMLNTIGIMAALMERQKSGKGQLVETALLRTALNYANTHLIEQALIQANRGPITNRGWTAGPQDCFKTRDGYIYALCIGNPLFRRWARLMGDEEKWTKDPRFKDDLARGDNGEILSAAMQEWCNTRTTAEVLEALAKARIPAGPVYTPQQALDDRHVNEAGFFEHVDYPGLPKAAPTVKPPVVLSRTPAEIRRRPPVLGEHTDEMMQALGYSATEIAELRDAKVI